uniref:Cytochrome P450 2F2-like n=2 Tax=Salarias fasciatus TaxID=181472 RepID=A0A672FPN2_SALFA
MISLPFFLCKPSPTSIPDSDSARTQRSKVHKEERQGLELNLSELPSESEGLFISAMLVSAVLVLVCVCFIVLRLTPRRPKNFPPGPAVLPMLGNLLSLSLDNPLADFERLRKSYGNIYSLYLGPTPAVFLNGVKAIREAMVVKGTDFAGRPQDMFVNHVSDHGKTKVGVILADYGSSWKEHRRFALMTLRNFGMGKNSMEDRIHGEIKYVVKTLEGSIGKPFSPQVMFHNAASNIICQVLFGTRYDYDDNFIKVIVQCFTENAKMANGPWAMLYDSLPIIRNLPLPFRKAFKNGVTVRALGRQLLTEHKKTRVPGEPRDFLDCYLDELDKRGEDSSFSEDQLIMYFLDLHFAGTDTTSNTLLTGFFYLMNFPHIQERCQQEIDRVLEGKDQVSFEDRHNMPYMQAVIHEVQRVANTVPLSVFHCTTKDTELMGYSIPKGMMIIENLTSVLNEEGQWKFPHEFNPENFLNDQGEFFKPEAFMPFSAGPRMCLGEGLARMELFLILVTLLRKFKFIWPEDAGEPDFTPAFGITLTPRPYRMKVELRSTD